jgi:hypothetical protein
LDSERRLRLAIETGRIGLWVWNWTDLKNVGDWSTQLKEIFGLPLDAEVTHDMFLKCVDGEHCVFCEIDAAPRAYGWPMALILVGITGSTMAKAIRSRRP